MSNTVSQQEKGGLNGYWKVVEEKERFALFN
jgi:hypothetical protein